VTEIKNQLENEKRELEKAKKKNLGVELKEMNKKT